MKWKFKKGGTALVIAGSDKGRQGKILDIDKQNFKVRLAGVRLQTHFDKKEGIQKKEGWIHYSNVQAVLNTKPQLAKPKR